MSTSIDENYPIYDPLPVLAHDSSHRSESDDYVSQEQFHSERVQVNPRYLNQTEFKSFQINCIYTGPKFANMRLIWLKNDKLLQVDSSSLNNQNSQTSLHQQNHLRRFFTLNYKQNFTNIGVLKFSYGLTTDTGVYKCVALFDNSGSVTKQAFSSLNDSSYLIVHKSMILVLIVSIYRLFM